MNEKKSLTRLFLKNTLWTLLQNSGNELIAFLVFLILARLLPPDAFGLVAMAGIYMFVMQIFIDQGLQTAIVQRENLEPEHLDSVFWMNIGVGMLWLLLSLTQAQRIAALFGQSALAPVISWLSLSFVFAALCMVQVAILKREMRFKELTLRNLAANIFGGVVGVGMALRGWGVWSLVGQQLSNYVVAVIVLWSVSKWRPRLRFSLRHFRELFSFGMHACGVSVLQAVNGRTDQYLIGRHLGSGVLGFYAVSGRVQILLNRVFVAGVGEVSSSAFSRLQHDHQRLVSAYYKCVRYLAVLALPAFAAFIVLAEEVFRIFFGNKWAGCVPVVQVLALIGMLDTVYGVNQPVIRAVGRPDMFLFWRLTQTAVNMGVFFWAIPYGLTGVVWAFAARAYVLAPVELLLMKRIIPITIGGFVKNIRAPLAASIFMYGCLVGAKHYHWLAGPPVIRLLESGLAGTVVYLVVLKVLEPSLLRDSLKYFRLLKSDENLDT